MTPDTCGKDTRSESVVFQDTKINAGWLEARESCKLLMILVF